MALDSLIGGKNGVRFLRWLRDLPRGRVGPDDRCDDRARERDRAGPAPRFASVSVDPVMIAVIDIAVIWALTAHGRDVTADLRPERYENGRPAAGGPPAFQLDGPPRETGCPMVTDAPPLTNADAPPAFHLLAKPTGAICNLDCEYCFFLSRRCSTPAAVPDGRRPAGDLPAAAARGAPAPEVTVAWQGGEPTLMGLDFFRARWSWRRSYRRPGQRIVQHDPDQRHPDRRRVGAFLGEHDFLVGVSSTAPAAARRLPRRQGRQGDLRPGDARPRRSCGGTRSSGTP